MSETVLTLICACPHDTDSHALAQALVKQRLAACVNLIPHTQSVYRWKGELCTDEQTLLLIKTQSARYAAVEALVRQHHSDAVPELIGGPVETGLGAYLDWVREQTARP